MGVKNNKLSICIYLVYYIYNIYRTSYRLGLLQLWDSYVATSGNPFVFQEIPVKIWAVKHIGAKNPELTQFQRVRCLQLQWETAIGKEKRAYCKIIALPGQLAK